MTLENRVYMFGCLRPREEKLAEQILGQAWLYHDDLRRAYNRKKRLERAQWAALLDSAHVTAYERHCALTGDAEEVARVQAAQREEKYKRLQDPHLEAVRELRGRRGHLLDAGTYWLTEAAVLQANKMIGLDPIKGRDFDGTGRIGAMIQSVDQFKAEAFEYPIPLAHPHPRVVLTTPNERGYAFLTIVVGALKDKRSITWPIKLHRAFPKDAVVKQVAVQRTRVGHRFKWTALFTIAYEHDLICEVTDQKATGVVGIDIGWRIETYIDEEGKKKSWQRVATCDGQDGAKDVLHIKTLSDFLYSDEVRGTRDEVFDKAKVKVHDTKAPGTEHVLLWKNKDRMRRLALKTGHVDALAWNERDKHLEDIECGVRARTQRRRLDTYRVYADKLAKTYRYVALEDMPMGDWVTKGETSKLERHRSTAALYLLQMIIAQRFGADRVDWVPAMNTSRTCGDCGLVRSTDVGPDPMWRCPCGAEHHQDENAAKIIRENSERWIAAGNPSRARISKAKKGKGKKNVNALATGDNLRMVVTAREYDVEAAE